MSDPAYFAGAVARLLTREQWPSHERGWNATPIFGQPPSRAHRRTISRWSSRLLPMHFDSDRLPPAVGLDDYNSAFRRPLRGWLLARSTHPGNLDAAGRDRFKFGRDDARPNAMCC